MNLNSLVLEKLKTAKINSLNLGYQQLKKEDIEVLTEAIKGNTLTSLNLEHNEIGSGVAYLSSYVFLQDLNLYNNKLNDEAKCLTRLTQLKMLNLGMNSLAETTLIEIGQKTSLTSLSLSNMPTKLTKSIIQALKENRSLVELDISSNCLNSKLVAELANNTLKSLNLSDNFLLDDIQAFFNTSITKLNIANTRVPAWQIIRLIEKMPLTSLNISSINFGADADKVIAAIKKKKELVKLSISHAALNEKQIKELSNLNLKKLNISGNPGASLAAFSNNNVIQGLAVSSTNPTAFDSLANNASLTTLEMRNCNLGDKDAKEMAAALTNLKKLDVSENDFTNAAMKAFSGMPLTNLTMENNKQLLGNGAGKYLQQNTTLKELNLNHSLSKDHFCKERIRKLTNLTLNHKGTMFNPVPGPAERDELLQQYKSSLNKYLEDELKRLGTTDNEKFNQLQEQYRILKTITTQNQLNELVETLKKITAEHQPGYGKFIREKWSDPTSFKHLRETLNKLPKLEIRRLEKS